MITIGAALRPVRSLIDHPANGLRFCTGSTGVSAENDVPAPVRDFAAMQPVHFMHCRNVQRTGPRSFREVAHPSTFG